MDNPKVTIITPVYNCREYIDETIASVLDQDYGNIDYIVIDDASTDGLNLPDNEEFKVIRHTVNRREQYTVNEALKLVTGKYFMIVNADDPLLMDAVSTLVEFMEANPDVLCAYPDWMVIDETGDIRRYVTTREYDFQWMVRHHTWLPSVGSIFRSSLIQQIGYRDISFKWLGDADYWLRVGLAGPMARVPATLACWRNRNGQASKDRSRRRGIEHIMVMQKFYQAPGLPQSLLDVKAEAVSWSYLVASVVTSSKLEALNYVITAVRNYPRMLRSIEFWDTVIKRLWFALRR